MLKEQVMKMVKAGISTGAPPTSNVIICGLSGGKFWLLGPPQFPLYTGCTTPYILRLPRYTIRLCFQRDTDIAKMQKGTSREKQILGGDMRA
jgi:hypothetical protein